MRKGVLLLVCVLLLALIISSINAELSIQGPSAQKLNVGDEITISGYLIEQHDILGFLLFQQSCNGQSQQLAKKSISIKKNVKKDFSEKLAITQTASDPCKIVVILESNNVEIEKAETNLFEVSDLLKTTFSIDKSSLQLGETASLTAEVFGADSTPVDGSAKIFLSQGTTVVFQDVQTFTDGKLSYTLPTDNLPAGTYSLSIQISDSFGNTASIDGGNIILSSIVNITISTDKNHYFPGTRVHISGEATTSTGKLSGTATLTFQNTTKETDISNGGFSFLIELDSRIPSGTIEFQVQGEDDHGNIGFASSSIIVDPIPTKLEVTADSSEYQSGSLVTITPSLYDQASSLMPSIITITVTSPERKRILAQTSESGTQITLQLEEKAPPGTYKIVAESQGLEDTSIFDVAHLQQIFSKIENLTLIMTNAGNEFFHGTLKVELLGQNKKYITLQKLKLDVNEFYTLLLSKIAPPGSYDVAVDDKVIGSITIPTIVKSQGFSKAWLPFAVAFLLAVILLLLKIPWKRNPHKRFAPHKPRDASSFISKQSSRGFTPWKPSSDKKDWRAAGSIHFRDNIKMQFSPKKSDDIYVYELPKKKERSFVATPPKTQETSFWGSWTNPSNSSSDNSYQQSSYSQPEKKEPEIKKGLFDMFN